MRRDGGENKNTIRMYILPRFTGIFFFFFFLSLYIYDALSISYRIGYRRGSTDFGSSASRKDSHHRRMGNSDRGIEIFSKGNTSFLHIYFFVFIPSSESVKERGVVKNFRGGREREGGIFLESNDGYSESTP